MTDTRVKLALDPPLLALVDAARGLVPRERWLRSLIEQHFDTVPQKPSAPPKPQPAPNPPQAPPPKPIVETSAHREFLESRGPKAGHEWVGTKDSCMRVGCPYPRDRKAHQ